MTREEITIPRWFLERIEDTLRIQYNINLDEKTGETCQDRNIKESLNGVRKLLKGEELTGGERLERLQPSLPSNLDETAEEYAENDSYGEPDRVFTAAFMGFKAGAEWMAGQGQTLDVEVKKDAGGYPYIPCIELYDYDKDEPLSKPGDKVIIQIRKAK